jgi:hypothetical protein
MDRIGRFRRADDVGVTDARGNITTFTNNAAGSTACEKRGQGASA